jgi:two-component system nitrate/nitrite response regulator NarL
MVMGDTKPSSKAFQGAERPLQLASKAEKPPSNGGERAAMSVVIDMSGPFHSGIEVEEANPSNGHVCVAAAVPKLSEREIQILDGLVKGYANKVIARRCDISEATVKVHMKSILRKIRVGNRTQAAIWALEHGHCSEDLKIDGLKANGNAEHNGTNGLQRAIEGTAR